MAKVSVATLEKWGRERLSRSFFLRDFLYSEIAGAHGLCNVPDDIELALEAGRGLCVNLLEPLQASFGRVAIRSAYRSPEVNRLGNERGFSCASNETNFAGHIWDRRDLTGRTGATACIVVPRFLDAYGHEQAGWKRLAWWIHDHLPYSEMEFFRPLWAFNLTWSDQPKREIRSWLETPRVLTRPGMANHTADHEPEWRGIEETCR